MFLKDRTQINSKRVYTEEGFLKVPAKIGRTGIQEYLAVEMGLTDREPDEVIKVYRPPEEVFKPESMSSFESKPITNNHPPELVDATNSKKYSVGVSGHKVSQDGMFLQADLFVMDQDSIRDIESGKAELSNGYTADIDWTPGVTPNGEQYDAIQRTIKGNHIAIVDRGRAGPACRVADSLNPNQDEEVNMAKITIDGVDFEVSEQAAQAVGKLQARVSDAEKEAKEKDETIKSKEDEMEEKEKEMKKQKDSLQAQLDEAKSKTPSAETLDNMVNDRLELISKVKKVCPDIEFKGKDSATLMKEVVAVKCPSVQMDSVSADYIQARFDILVDSIDQNSQSNLENGLNEQITNDSGEEAYVSPSELARQKMIDRNRKAWNPNKEEA